MKFSLALASIALAGSVVAGPLPRQNGSCGTDQLGLPSDGMKMTNGVPFGWNADTGSISMAKLNQITGRKATTYGDFAHINDPSGFDGKDMLGELDAVKASGAVFVPAVMLDHIQFTDVTPKIAGDVAGVLKQFTDQGIKVWLRFCHEMNYYVTTGDYNGTPDEFIAAWKVMHDAVKDNKDILMFWSPNQDDADSIKPWFPGPDYVDIYGYDIYPDPGKTFDDAYGEFYQAFVQPANKPFAIGETSSVGSDVGAKEDWLKQFATANTATYPCFASVSWFEYAKDGLDYRIIDGQDPATVQQTLGNFQ